MTTTEHTPGPWQQNWQFIVAPDPDGIHPDIYIAEIAEEDSEGRIASPEQQEANGKLIVAAPKLLEALKAMAEQADQDCPHECRSRHFTDAIEQAYAAIRAATAECPPCESEEPDIHSILAAHRQIAVVWSIEDVQETRPELTDEQAWAVLQAVSHYHDATIGINWDVLACHAAMLFPRAPKTDKAVEA